MNVNNIRRRNVFSRGVKEEHTRMLLRQLPVLEYHVDTLFFFRRRRASLARSVLCKSLGVSVVIFCAPGWFFVSELSMGLWGCVSRTITVVSCNLSQKPAVFMCGLSNISYRSLATWEKKSIFFVGGRTVCRKKKKKTNSGFKKINELHVYCSGQYQLKIKLFSFVIEQ